MTCASVVVSLLLVLQQFGPWMLQSGEVSFPFGSNSLNAHSIMLTSNTGISLQARTSESSLSIRVTEPVQLALSADGGVAVAGATPVKFVGTVNVFADVAIERQCDGWFGTCTNPSYVVSACNVSTRTDVHVNGMGLLKDFVQDHCSEIREALVGFKLPASSKAKGKNSAHSEKAASRGTVLSSEETMDTVKALFSPTRVVTVGLKAEAHRSNSGQTSLALSASQDCAELQLSFPPAEPSDASIVKNMELNVTLPEDSTASLELTKDGFVESFALSGLGNEVDALTDLLDPFMQVILTTIRVAHSDGITLKVLRDLAEQVVALSSKEGSHDTIDEGDL